MAQILETRRLVLRHFVSEDSIALARVLSDPVAMKFYPAPHDRTGVEQWIERNLQRYSRDGIGLWAMDLKATGELIGDCGITRQQIENEFFYEIGYHLRRDHWGNGYATEAAIACRDWGFANLKTNR